MDEPLLKQIQTWTNSVPLIILGSGASVPFGLPTMWKLGEYLKAEISFNSDENQEQFNEFKKCLDETEDLEKALTETKLNNQVVSEIVKKTWSLVNATDMNAYENIINGKVEIPLNKLIKYLINTAERKLSIVTTNYDRLAEYAASLANAFVYNGYSQNLIGHFSKSIEENHLNKLRGFSGQVNILKVHGSLDWFKNKDDENIQLPLRHTIPPNYLPSIVTPGTSKYLETHNEPYRTIFSIADREVEAAKGFLCIGYGFNDIHVQPYLIKQIKDNKPIIVITKELTPQTKEATIGNGCKNYILIEEANENDTRIFSSSFGEYIIENESYWELNSFLKLIL